MRVLRLLHRCGLPQDDEHQREILRVERRWHYGFVLHFELCFGVWHDEVEEQGYEDCWLGVSGLIDIDTIEAVTIFF